MKDEVKTGSSLMGIAGENLSNGEVQSSEPRLLPCPFCGGAVTMSVTIIDCAISCDCGASMMKEFAIHGNGKSEKAGLTAEWNRRTSPLDGGRPL